MCWLLRLFKRKDENNCPHDEFQKWFNNAIIANTKTILDAKIIGDTLSVAIAKVDPLIICPYKVDGIVIGHEEVYMSHRFNVAIYDGIITEILFVG